MTETGFPLPSAKCRYAEQSNIAPQVWVVGEARK
jgi:hypothetical protein